MLAKYFENLQKFRFSTDANLFDPLAAHRKVGGHPPPRPPLPGPSPNLYEMAALTSELDTQQVGQPGQPDRTTIYLYLSIYIYLYIYELSIYIFLSMNYLSISIFVILSLNLSSSRLTLPPPVFPIKTVFFHSQMFQ